MTRDDGHDGGEVLEYASERVGQDGVVGARLPGWAAGVVTVAGMGLGIVGSLGVAGGILMLFAALLGGGRASEMWLSTVTAVAVGGACCGLSFWMLSVVDRRG